MFATGLVAGIFLVVTARTGIWFGSLVDHHRKQTVMQASAVASSALVRRRSPSTSPRRSSPDPASAWLWMLVVLLMFGVIAGNIRTIALPTLVTVLIPEHLGPGQRPGRHCGRACPSW